MKMVFGVIQIKEKIMKLFDRLMNAHEVKMQLYVMKIMNGDLIISGVEEASEDDNSIILVNPMLIIMRQVKGQNKIVLTRYITADLVSSNRFEMDARYILLCNSPSDKIAELYANMLNKKSIPIETPEPVSIDTISGIGANNVVLLDNFRKNKNFITTDTDDSDPPDSVA
jgi:hypothetical protein